MYHRSDSDYNTGHLWFSLLFEVADKSFKVADRAIHKGGAICDRGRVTEERRIQRSGQRRDETRHRMFKQGAGHLDRDWSRGSDGSPLLEGGLGGHPKN